MEKLTFTWARLSNVTLIMAIMCVPLVELPCQTTMGCIPTLEYLPPVVHGAYGHILSCQALNTTAS
jgi:hypothetical protein